MKFINEDGNQLLMNGINFVCKDKNEGYLEPNIEELQHIYSQRGFNLARLGIFWDAVEPEPRFFDQVYLDKIAKVVEVAQECGIYILLDMHQDLFSVKFC